LCYFTYSILVSKFLFHSLSRCKYCMYDHIRCKYCMYDHIWCKYCMYDYIRCKYCMYDHIRCNLEKIRHYQDSIINGIYAIIMLSFQCYTKSEYQVKCEWLTLIYVRFKLALCTISVQPELYLKCRCVLLFSTTCATLVYYCLILRVEVFYTYTLCYTSIFLYSIIIFGLLRSYLYFWHYMVRLSKARLVCVGVDVCKLLASYMRVCFTKYATLCRKSIYHIVSNIVLYLNRQKYL